MESVMTESQEQIALDLHESTNTIRRVMHELLPQTSESTPHAATPQQMSLLLSELMRTGQTLRVLPTNRGGDLEQAICEYRQQVERLRSFLPAIQTSLLAERARLERERERLNGAAAWAQASLQTLAR
jgi:hypothetical protein